jgi:hypothetical protein
MVNCFLRAFAVDEVYVAICCYLLRGLTAQADVCDAAGHSNVAITSGYLHVVVEEDETSARTAPASSPVPRREPEETHADNLII